jgi:hypothetical protein
MGLWVVEQQPVLDRSFYLQFDSYGFRSAWNSVMKIRWPGVGSGALTGLVVLMAYTILLIPVSLLGLGLLLAATTLGTVPYACILGNQICTRFRWKLTNGQEAAVGMILLTLIGELLRLIPLIGTLLVLFPFVSSFGAALLTHFGTRPFVADFTN